MQHSQHPQMSVRHWRRTLPLPLHCGYSVKSRRDSQIFHDQTRICSFPEMNKGQFEATQMAHNMLNTLLVSLKKFPGVYTKGMEIIFISTTQNELIILIRILLKK